MTKEMIYNTAREIMRELMWLTEAEEKEVMSLVNTWLSEKRQLQGNQRGNV